MYYILFLILMMLALFFTKLNFLNSMKKNTQQFIENFKPKYTPHKLLRLNDDNFNPCDNWWNCTKNSSKLGSKWCDGYPSQCSEYRNIIPDSKLNNNNETNKSDSINLSKILKRIPRSLKEELTWDKICEQVGKPRWNGNHKSRFNLIRESLSDYRRKKRL